MADIIIDGTSVISKTGSTVNITNDVVFPAGHLLQVKIASRAYGDGISHGSTNYIDINSITLTPVSYTHQTLPTTPYV